MELDKKTREIVSTINKLDIHSKVIAINKIKKEIHCISPFKHEPVDCVLWVKSESVIANDYNPNRVAPPEMRLLEHSIRQDGYTQPIVTWENDEAFEVVDGYHRNRVGKETIDIRSRIKGYLPVTIVNTERTSKNDRVASTIRHNRARGRHTVDGMSDIVVELKRRNWSNEKISKELGMEQDEILRLVQITGLAEMFNDRDFSLSWDIEKNIVDENFEYLDDESISDDEANNFRVATNTSDKTRIFHEWHKWECYKAGFYSTKKEGMTPKQCEAAYRDFLSNEKLFSETLEKVIKEWKNSCEHYLTNPASNRIAWLGQAACCYELGIPAKYRSGFNLLSEEQKELANKIALNYLNIWLKKNGMSKVTMEEATGGSRQVELY